MREKSVKQVYFTHLAPSSFIYSPCFQLQVFILSHQSLSISFAGSSPFPLPFLLENSSFLFFSSSTIVISLSLIVLKASYGKESACNAGDPGSIPGSGRSSGERNGYPSSILAEEIPRTEEPGGLPSIGLQSQTQLSD